MKKEINKSINPIRLGIFVNIIFLIMIIYFYNNIYLFFFLCVILTLIMFYNMIKSRRYNKKDRIVIFFDITITLIVFISIFLLLYLHINLWLTFIPYSLGIIIAGIITIKYRLLWVGVVEGWEFRIKGNKAIKISYTTSIIGIISLIFFILMCYLNVPIS